MSEIQNLCAQVSGYAQERQRVFDAAVLETVLTLRQTHDELPHFYWPLGTVKHLLTVRWPKSGPTDIPAREVLLGTLDTYWRFIRGTGQATFDSASPADLKKAAKRWSRDFERAIDDRLNPAAPVAPTPIGRPLTSRKVVTAEPTVQDEQPNTTPAAQETGCGDCCEPESTPTVLTNAFVDACVALVKWTTPGREVTGSGVLRPAVAKEAFADLGLAAWETTWQAALSPAAVTATKKNLGVGRSAAVCVALNRLWAACVATDIITVDAKEARVNETVDAQAIAPALGAALLRTGLTDEHRDLAHRVLSAAAQAPAAAIAVTEVIKDSETADLQDLTGYLHDAQLWNHDGDKITLTEFGQSVAATLTA